MEYLSKDDFLRVHSHKGYPICTAKEPQKYGFWDYIIDDFCFYGRAFITVQDAMYAIDEKEEAHETKGCNEPV